jgi:hypothetical protein
MTKQRLIFIVALVCIAQLGFVIVTEVNRNISDRSQQGRAVVSRTVSRTVPLKQGPESDRASLKPNSSADESQTAKTKTIETKAKDSTAKGDTKSAIPSKQREPRDPFVPFFSIKPGEGSASTSTPTDFELSELRVTAIIKDSKGTYSASVKAPNDRNFIVKVGSAIGSDGGRISSITESKIIVTDSSADNSSAQSLATTKELVIKRSEPTQE